MNPETRPHSNSSVQACQNCKNDFTIESEDFNFYEKIKVPAPTFCPECRMIRRMLWRNERSLYKRICEATGKQVISCFSPESGITVYDRDYWWSDAWDPMSFGKEYDFSKSFFEQYSELLHTAPFPNLFNARSINSTYSNHVGEMKNAYLTFASWISEDILYSAKIGNSKNLMDCLSCTNSEFCFECTSVHGSNKVFFSQNCVSCIESWFLYDCSDCMNCFGCTNLRNKSYCIYNQQYTKEEYFEKLKYFNLSSLQSILNLRKESASLNINAIHRFASMKQAFNSTGNNLTETNNCKFCFDCYQDVSDCKYCINGIGKMTDTYDGYGPGLGDLMYEVVDSGDRASYLMSTTVVWNCVRVSYSQNCHGCSDLFGCIGLRNKKYCIFNKQYTKEDYEDLLPKIKSHMKEFPYIDSHNRVFSYGDFFPYDFSPFTYNETIAHEYVPKTKEQALDEGFRWHKDEEKNYSITIEANDLPDTLPPEDDTILSMVIGCFNKGNSQTKCTTAFKIVKEELSFYRRFNLSLPKFCPNCRFYKRMELSNPPKLWHRQCMCNKENHEHKGNCQVEFETSYAPERPETVYCEKCYQQEIY